jgi:hypothetical protein
MYFYFYDDTTQQKKHLNELRLIETSLIDLGISGRIEKLSPFSGIRDQLSNAVKQGVTTVVVVGEDSTFVEAVDVVAKHDGVALAFIALEKSSIYAQVLGMPIGSAACEVISKRLYQTVDLGRANNTHFLGALRVPTGPSLQIRCDDQYTITRTDKADTITIQNIGDVLSDGPENLFPAHDSQLQLVIESTQQKRLFRRATQELTTSILPVQYIDIQAPNDSLTLEADHTISVTAPCRVMVDSAKLKLIVGRQRRIPQEKPLV